MRRALFLLVVVTGCRFGGPEEDPMTPTGSPAPSNDSAASVDTSEPDTLVEDTGESDVAETSIDSAETPDASCDPPFVPAVCDPVKNTGCSSLSRCDVADEPRTGRCVGLAALGEGAFCTKTTLTDTCASTLTCVSSKCRKLCLCDADCGGRCCNFDVPAGSASSGFRACGDC